MSKKKSKDTTNLKQEEVLTAVVCADNFNNKFYPVDVTRPKCLLPLANKPLLYYTLQFLIKSSVRQIYIFCAKCGDQVKDYIQNSKWKSKELCGANVELICSQDVTCVGDVFRHLDEHSTIAHDFIFVPCDVVSNGSLSLAVEEHKERRSKHKDTPLLTVVLKEVSPRHSSRMSEDDVHVVHDVNTKRIYQYKKLKASDQYSTKLPLSILLNPETRAKANYSMMNTGIWICSPKVAHNFTDNFDFSTPAEFIKGVIDDEVLGHHIHMHLLEGAYCNRVVNLQSYNIVQQNIIDRWLYPIVPENIDEYEFLKSIDDQSEGENKAEVGKFKLRQNSVYVHDSCDLAQYDVIKGHTIVGADTKIDRLCQVRNSVLGKSCDIADRCIITNCTLMNNVKIGRGCRITNSFICNNVVIGDHVTIEDGCILCDDVHISDDITLHEDNVIFLYRTKYAYDQKQEIEDGFAQEIVGKDGRGFVWDGIYTNDDMSDTEEHDFDDKSSVGSQDSIVEAIRRKMWGLKLNELDHSKWTPALKEDDEDDELIDDVAEGGQYTSDDDQFGIDNQFSTFTPRNLKKFEAEVVETVSRKFSDNVEWENLFLEINGSKHANNISVEDLVKTVTKSLLLISISKAEEEGKSFIKIFNGVVKNSTSLLKNYIRDEKQEMLTLQVYEKFASEQPQVLNALDKVLFLLYNENFASEKVILSWYYQNPTDATRLKIKEVVEWLENASEEESSSEEESDDE